MMLRLIILLIALASFPQWSQQQSLGCSSYILQPQNGPQIIGSGGQFQLSIVNSDQGLGLTFENVYFVSGDNDGVQVGQTPLTASSYSTTLGNPLIIQVSAPYVSSPQFFAVNAAATTPSGERCQFSVTESIVLLPSTTCIS
ncbi:hypothetical protein BJ742DRAFT_281698 [Cladochytrium replicatum]|nr:hypothetical protein BJ742DRAFT_281698 [Cladochytrium replicatum]